MSSIVQERETAARFDLPPDVRALKQKAAAFIEREVWPIEEKVARTERIDPADVAELRRKARGEGFAMLNIPERYGGKGLSMLAQVAVEEEAGRATNGLGFVVADRGPRELLQMASADQIDRFVLPVIREGGREAWAITEPGAGSDTGALTTRAERRGSEWVINGEKWFVTAGDIAAFLIVQAAVDRGQGLFLVRRDNPGVEIVRTPAFMHDPYIDRHAEIRFRDCRVPERDRVPSEGDEATRAWFSAERVFIAARACGTAERVIELARKWALERVAYGYPIADYQGVQFPLADSLTELAATRLLTYHVAEAYDRGQDPKILHGKAAMAKLLGSEMVMRATDRALQIFGGRGFMNEHVVNRYYREVRVDRIWEGTSEIQRLIIARGLLKRGAKPYLA